MGIALGLLGYIELCSRFLNAHYKIKCAIDLLQKHVKECEQMYNNPPPHAS
jgi:hypothetical protein